MFSKSLFYSSVISVLTIYSCSNEPSSQGRDLEKKLIGEWKSNTLRLTMNTFQNKDTVMVFDVPEGEWESKMNIRPVTTIYFADGTYISEHTSLKDSVLFNPGGYWNVNGDTIMVRDTFPEMGRIYKYKLAISNGIAEFNGMEDCDGDGKADDNYFGTLRKQKRK